MEGKRNGNTQPFIQILIECLLSANCEQDKVGACTHGA